MQQEKKMENVQNNHDVICSFLLSLHVHFFELKLTIQKQIHVFLKEIINLKKSF